MWLHDNIQHFIFRFIQTPPANSNKQQILDGSVCTPCWGSLNQPVETHVHAGRFGLWVIRVIRSSGYGIRRERERERKKRERS